MSITLRADQVPGMGIPISGIPLLSSAENSAGTNGPLVLRTIIAGVLPFAAKWNRNAKSIELIGRYGAGNYGIGLSITNGLVLTAGAGLLGSISPGQAMMDGPVELSVTTNVGPVPNNTSDIFVALKQDGTLIFATSIGVLPATPYVYLGHLTTLAGTIQSVDYSGVFYLTGGMAWRQTADIAVPLDTPNTFQRFWTKTLGGWYLWTGTNYIGVGNFPDTIQVITSNEFDTPSQQGNVTTNTGAITEPFVFLAPAQPGLRRTFIVDSAIGIRVVASKGCTIRLGGLVGGYVESLTVGDSLVLIAINSTEWMACPYQGTWTVGAVPSGQGSSLQVAPIGSMKWLLKI